MSRSQEHGKVFSRTHFGALFFGFAAASGLWLLFISAPNKHELMLGAVSVVATMAFVFPVSRTMNTDLTVQLRDFMQCVHIPWMITTGVLQITWVLLKDLLHVQPAGDFYRVCGFESSKRDPVRKARTVMAIAFTTMTPNLIVLGVDVSKSRMLFHQIDRTDVPQLTKNLGAHG